MKAEDLNMHAVPGLYWGDKLGITKNEYVRPSVIIPRALWDKVGELADKHNTTRSEVLRAALYYVIENVEG